MTRIRFSLAQWMAIVLCVGLGFAALRNANELWASVIYNLAVVMIAVALVFAFARKGKTRPRWIGFAAFGWTYLLVAQLPDRGHGGLGFGPIPQPTLLIDWALARFYPYINANQGSMANAYQYQVAYEQVSLSLGIILFGLAGAVLGHFLAEDDGPTH